MESDIDVRGYKPVYVSVRITAEANELLSDAAKRSGRTKTQEAKLRLHDHLERYRSIAEVGAEKTAK